MFCSDSERPRCGGVIGHDVHVDMMTMSSCAFGAPIALCVGVGGGGGGVNGSLN